MIFLVPVVLIVFGLSTGRDALVWLAIGLFVWLSWSREKSARKSRLWSVPMPNDVRVPEFGGGSVGSSGARTETSGGPCHCA